MKAANLIVLIMLACASALANPCPSNMVLVESTCVDRYEWPNVVGELPLTGASALPDPIDQRAGLTIDAETICAQDGKRMCSLDEWRAACEGTPIESCDVDKRWRPVNWMRVAARDPEYMIELDQSDPIGTYPECVSRAGVHDALGSVEELVRCDGPHGVCQVGGFWATARSCRAKIGNHAGAWHGYHTGFRCCASPGGHIRPLTRPHRGGEPSPWPFQRRNRGRIWASAGPFGAAIGLTGEILPLWAPQIGRLTAQAPLPGGILAHRWASWGAFGPCWPRPAPESPPVGAPCRPMGRPGGALTARTGAEPGALRAAAEEALWERLETEVPWARSSSSPPARAWQGRIATMADLLTRIGGRGELRDAVNDVAMLAGIAWHECRFRLKCDAPASFGPMQLERYAHRWLPDIDAQWDGITRAQLEEPATNIRAAYSILHHHQNACGPDPIGWVQAYRVGHCSEPDDNAKMRWRTIAKLTRSLRRHMQRAAPAVRVVFLPHHRPVLSEEAPLEIRLIATPREADRVAKQTPVESPVVIASTDRSDVAR